MPIDHLVTQALFSYFIRHALQYLFVLLFFAWICRLITWLDKHYSRTLFGTHSNPYLFDLVFRQDMPINHLVRQASLSYFIRRALQSLFVLLFFLWKCLLITWLHKHYSRTLFGTHSNPYLFDLFSVDMPINHLVRQASYSHFIRHALQSLLFLFFFSWKCVLITWLDKQHSRTFFSRHYNPYLFYFFSVRNAYLSLA